MYCWFCGHPVTFPTSLQNQTVVPGGCVGCGAAYGVSLLYPSKMSAEQLKKIRNAYTEQTR